MDKGSPPPNQPGFTELHNSTLSVNDPRKGSKSITQADSLLKPLSPPNPLPATPLCSPKQSHDSTVAVDQNPPQVSRPHLAHDSDESTMPFEKSQPPTMKIVSTSSLSETSEKDGSHQASDNETETAQRMGPLFSQQRRLLDLLHHDTPHIDFHGHPHPSSPPVAIRDREEFEAFPSPQSATGGFDPDCTLNTT